MEGKTTLSLILSILFLLILATACTQQPKISTLEEARQVTVDHIMKSDIYTQNDVENFTEIYVHNESCQGCYQFQYYFQVTNSPDVKAYVVRVEMINTEISGLNITQISDDYCQSYSPEQCPQGCIVCPPCPECSSIKCQEASVCESLGFDKEWYNFSVLQAGNQCTQPVADNTADNATSADNTVPETNIPIADRYNGDTTCENVCGDGVCEDSVCQDPGCPCEENKVNCPEDCG